MVGHGGVVRVLRWLLTEKEMGKRKEEMAARGGGRRRALGFGAGIKKGRARRVRWWLKGEDHRVPSRHRRALCWRRRQGEKKRGSKRYRTGKERARGEDGLAPCWAARKVGCTRGREGSCGLGWSVEKARKERREKKGTGRVRAQGERRRGFSLF
jgi:hypothetical protein